MRHRNGRLLGLAMATLLAATLVIGATTAALAAANSHSAFTAAASVSPNDGWPSSGGQLL
jgi:hypothetical protein